MAEKSLIARFQIPYRTRHFGGLRCLVFAMFSAALPGCADNPQAVKEGTASQKPICLKSDSQVIPLHVEIARSARQRAQGLMDRSSLAPGSGMLFTFDKEQPAGRSFWMYRTKIPLDIAFLDKRGTILVINQMQPCSENNKQRCALYPAGKPFWYALETNLGFFQRHGITPGGQVDLDPVGPCRRATRPESEPVTGNPARNP